MYVVSVVTIHRNSLYRAAVVVDLQLAGHAQRIEKPEVREMAVDESSEIAEFFGNLEKRNLLRLREKLVLLDFQLLDF